MPTSLPLLPFSHNRSTPAFPLPSTAAASSSSSVSHASSPLTPTRTRPPPLSAKARGKQRANPFLSSPSDLTTVENSQRQSLAHPASRHLTIRFTSEGVPDLSLIIEPSESLGQLKNRIRSLRPALSFNPLRFIHLGRVLPPETIIIPTLTRRTRLRPSETSRADDKKRGETAPAADQGKEDQAQEGLWLQCSVGLPVQEQEDGEIDKRQGEEAATSQTAPLRGFDLLRSTAGMTDEDIAAMRRQFHASSGDASDPHSNAELEERFLDGSLTPETDPRNAVDKYITLLQGLLTSFIFPLTPCFFFDEHPRHSFLSPGMREETGRSVVFSRRMEISLIIGLALNIGFGALKLLAS